MRLTNSLLIIIGMVLAGCGVSETASVAATAGAAKAKEAEQNVPAQVQGKLDEAAKQAEQKREGADAR